MPRTRPSEPGPIIPGSNGKRPPPPPQLNASERAIWREFTARLPPDWFTASAPLLKELCRHVRLADNLSEDITRARATIDELQKMPEPPAKPLKEATKEYRVLLRMHGFQSQRIGAMMTRLRLTPQSRYQAVHGESQGRRGGRGGRALERLAGGQSLAVVQYNRR
jgi:hypothetical protein